MRLLKVFGAAVTGLALAGCADLSRNQSREKKWENYSPLSAARTVIPSIDDVDMDKSGVLSKDEVDKYVWEEIDTDKDGKLSIDEILKFRDVVNKFHHATYDFDTIYNNWHESYDSLSSIYRNLTISAIEEIQKQVIGPKERIDPDKLFDFPKNTPRGKDCWIEPLGGVRTAAPGIDLFDYDANQVLEGQEVDDYIKVVIDKNHDGEISMEEMEFLQSIINGLNHEIHESSVNLVNLRMTRDNFREQHQALITAEYLREGE